MSAFLECVSELCNHATKQDRSFLLPHTIKGSKVDGYSIKLHGNSSGLDTSAEVHVVEFEMVVGLECKRILARICFFIDFIVSKQCILFLCIYALLCAS